MKKIFYSMIKKNQNPLFIIMIMIMMLSGNYKSSAQLTIGSETEPLPGSLLDLKEKDAGGDEPNSSKSLGLPRVALSKLSTLTTDDNSRGMHYVGQLVYNVTENEELTKGTYYWDGSKWNKIAVEMKQNSYSLQDVYTYTMEKIKTSNINTGYVDLGIELTVTIPPKAEGLFLIDYSIPINFERTPATSVGYIGTTLYKIDGNGVDTELEAGSRKFNVFKDSYVNVAVGMPVAGKAVDRIINDTNTSMTCRYYLKGYIEANTSSTNIKFGMYAETGANYNWGKGNMSITSYLKGR
jgi:hypothetical protein